MTSIELMPEPPAAVEPFVNAARISEVTGFSVTHLAQLRRSGKGPRYYAPTSRRIFYKLAEVHAWIAASERTATDQDAR